MEFTVRAPGTVLDVLAAFHPDASKRTLRAMVDAGRVRIDGEVVRVAKQEVPKGVTVTIGPTSQKKAAPSKVRSADADADAAGEVGQDTPTGLSETDVLAAARRARVRVLHEDRDLLVLDKPAGLLSVPTAKGRAGTEAEDLASRAKRYMASRRGASLRARRRVKHQRTRETEETTEGPPAPRRDLPRLERGDAYPFLTIERDASGCVVFAKDSEAHGALVERAAEAPVEVTMEAVVVGRIKPGPGTWTVRVSESTTGQAYATPSPKHGREVTITYESVEADPWHLHPGHDGSPLPTTRIRFRASVASGALIRAALTASGHPVLGERAFAGKGRRVPSPARRLLLHVSSVRLLHPFTGEPVEVSAPLPSSFQGDLTGHVPTGPRKTGVRRGTKRPQAPADDPARDDRRPRDR